MTPTLGGRIQTRLVLMSSIGLLWTLIISGLLPHPDSMPIRTVYRITLVTSIATTLLGIVWEFVYHAVQQLRWDKDWPSMLGLLTGPIEAVPVWLVIHGLSLVPGEGGLSSAILPLYIIHFGSTWLLLWLVGLGPLHIVQPRWRFEGGTFSKRPPDALVPFVVTNIGMVFALVVLWLVWR